MVCGCRGGLPRRAARHRRRRLPHPPAERRSGIAAEDRVRHQPDDRDRDVQRRRDQPRRRDVHQPAAGMLLQIAAVAGGLARCRWSSTGLSDRTLYIIFASRDRGDRGGDADAARPAQRDPGFAPSSPARSAGAITRRKAAARSSTSVRRLPAALGVSLGGGILSGLLGIGGGILQVPALNAWCGIPMRAAAATTAAHDRVTALGSAPIYYARGVSRAARRRGSRSACSSGPGPACGIGPRANARG